MGLPDKCKTCPNFETCSKESNNMRGPLFDGKTSVHKKIEELGTMYLTMSNPRYQELMRQHENEINEILATVTREQLQVVCSRIVGVSSQAATEAVLDLLAGEEPAGGNA